MSDLNVFKQPEHVIINCLVTLHFLSCSELSFNVYRIEVINILTQRSSTINFVIHHCSLIMIKKLLLRDILILCCFSIN